LKNPVLHVIFCIMTIEQTVEIGKNGWFHLDLHTEYPAGTSAKVVVTAPADAKAAPHNHLTERQRAAIVKCRGLAKRMGSRLTSADFLEQRRKDKELEDRLDASHEEERRRSREQRQGE
jgi:hypothetical protein